MMWCHFVVISTVKFLLSASLSVGKLGNHRTRQLSVQEDTQSSTVADITMATAVSCAKSSQAFLPNLRGKVGMERLCMVLML